ncbi:condensation domain-containing protein, partial [Xanthomonas sp. GPE 39]|uniref:condensation domain-containing protein n=1 Tax=Xanthomonas sp. GPE 39 TaxID=1583099 RepID=UPI001910E96E
MDEGLNICMGANEDAWFPLSENQRALWFLYKLHPDLQGTYNISFFARILGEIDLNLLKRAIVELASRHAMLRTRFRELNSVPEQMSERFVEAQLRLVDVSELDPLSLDELVIKDSFRPFDVTVAPLFRVDLYQVGVREGVLLVTFNHLVVDGWSFWRLIEELGNILDEMVGVAPLKPCHSYGHEPELSYSDYVKWQRDWLNGEDGDRQFTYWQKMLEDECPSLNLPARAPSALLPPASRGCMSFNLDAGLSVKLSEMAARNHASLYVVLLTTYFIFLRRLTGQDDFHVGSPMPARRGRKWSEVVGMFFNQIVLRAGFNSDLTVRELLEMVRSRVRRAMGNQDFPFSELVARLNPPREKNRSPFFQTMFLFQDARGSSDVLNILAGGEDLAPVSWGGLHLTHFCHPPISGAGALDLILEAVKSGNKIFFLLNFDSSLFEHSTLERWMEHWRHLLAAMVAEGAEDQLVDRLPLLDEAERHQLLTQWNATAVDYPRDACVHELFEMQVARAPSAIAVVQGER